MLLDTIYLEMQDLFVYHTIACRQNAQQVGNVTLAADVVVDVMCAGDLLAPRQRV